MDIGALWNELVEKLQDSGYRNSLGIDDDKKFIEWSKYGRHLNFHQLKRSDKFEILHLSYILAYFSDGLPDLAGKLKQHLIPGGYLIFNDNPDDCLEFAKALKAKGFKQIFIPADLRRESYSAWQI